MTALKLLLSMRQLLQSLISIKLTSIVLIYVILIAINLFRSIFIYIFVSQI